MADGRDVVSYRLSTKCPAIVRPRNFAIELSDEDPGFRPFPAWGLIRTHLTEADTL